MVLTCDEDNTDPWAPPVVNGTSIYPRSLCQVCAIGGLSNDSDPRRGYFKGRLTFGPVVVPAGAFDDYLLPLRLDQNVGSTTTSTTSTTTDALCKRTGCCQEESDAWCGFLPNGRPNPDCSCTASWELNTSLSIPAGLRCGAGNCNYKCQYCKSPQWVCQDEPDAFLCPGTNLSQRCAEDVYGARCNHYYWGECWRQFCQGQCGCPPTSTTTTTVDPAYIPPNAITAEDYVREYRVYFVDGWLRRLGGPVAVVPRSRDMAFAQDCCDMGAYKVDVDAVLPRGCERLMIVPVTVYDLELPTGVTTDPIVDDTSEEPALPDGWPLANFSILLTFAEAVRAGTGQLRVVAATGTRTSPAGTKATATCDSDTVVVGQYALLPVRTLLSSYTKHYLELPDTCFMDSQGRPAYAVAGYGAFRTIQRGAAATDFDVAAPTLIGPPLLSPPSGVLVGGTAEGFTVFFEEAVWRGWAPVTIWRRASVWSNTTWEVFDSTPLVVLDTNMPGKVAIRPSASPMLPPGAEYRLSFGAGAFRDAAWNYADGSSALLPDGYRIRVAMPSVPSGWPFDAYPPPGAEGVSVFSNILLDFRQLAARGEGRLELCSGWSPTNVCSPRQSLSPSRVIFLGSKVLINPGFRLEMGRQYNLSMTAGFIANLPALYADGSGAWPYGFTTAKTVAQNTLPPVLAGAWADCNSDGDLDDICQAGATSFPEAMGQVGKGGPLPATASFKLYFSEKVALVRGGRAVLWRHKKGPVREEKVLLDSNVTLVMDTLADDPAVTLRPTLEPGNKYTLELLRGALAGYGNGANTYAGINLTFYTPCVTPRVVLASDGPTNVAKASAIQLQFAGPTEVPDDALGRKAIIKDMTVGEVQELPIDDPEKVVFIGDSVLLLPDPELRPGRDYSLMLPLGSVLFLETDVQASFSTREEQREVHGLDIFPGRLVAALGHYLYLGKDGVVDFASLFNSSCILATDIDGVSDNHTQDGDDDAIDEDDDVLPPRVEWFDVSHIAVDGTVTLMFSEAIELLQSRRSVPIIATNSSGVPAIIQADAMTQGNVLTAFIRVDRGTTYSLAQVPSAITDVSGNVGRPPDFSMVFTMGAYSKGAGVSLVPGGRGVALGRNDALVLEFDGVVEAGSGRISVILLSNMTVVAEVVAATVPLMSFTRGGAKLSAAYVDVGKPFLPGGAYAVQLADLSFHDLAGKPLRGPPARLLFNCQLERDRQPPYLYAASFNGAAPQPAFQGSRFTLYFNEAVRLRPSDIMRVRLLPSSGGSNCNMGGKCEPQGNCTEQCGYAPASRAIDIADDDLEVDGAAVWVHIAGLEAGKGYKLVIDAGKVRDVEGNSMDALDGEEAGFVFRAVLDVQVTGPAVVDVSPMDRERKVALSTTISITFDEGVEAGDGALRLEPLQGGGRTVRIPVKACRIWGPTLICLPPALLERATTYAILLEDGAVLDAATGSVPVTGPNGTNGTTGGTTFTTIDADQVPPVLVGASSGGTRFPPRWRERRAVGGEAGAPNATAAPLVQILGGIAVLTLHFSEIVEPGRGFVVIEDCSPGVPNVCYDGVHEQVPDAEVLRIDVRNSTCLLHFDGAIVDVVMGRLTGGHWYSVKTDAPGVFVDRVGMKLAPVQGGLEFRILPDDVLPPFLFEEVPQNGSQSGKAAPNANITLYFSEAVNVTGPLVYVNDGAATYAIPTDNSDPAVGLVTVRGTVVTIDPYADMAYNATVTVFVPAGTFTDRYGNANAEIGQYQFRTTEARFEALLPNDPYPNGRPSPREGAALQLVNDTLMLLGGRSGDRCVADAWTTKDGLEWSQVRGMQSATKGKLPYAGAYSPTAVDRRGCLWMLGGECNNDLGTVWKTCNLGGLWTLLPTPVAIPVGMQVPQRFPAAFKGHAIAIVMGWQLLVVDAADPLTGGVWTAVDSEVTYVQKVASAPLPFGARSEPYLVVSSDDIVYLLGGYAGMDGQGNFNLLRDVWASFDVGTSWRCFTASYAQSRAVPPGIPRRAQVVMMQDDTIFLLGGQLASGREGSNQVYSSQAGLRGAALNPPAPYIVQPVLVGGAADTIVPARGVFLVTFGQGVQMGSVPVRILEVGVGNRTYNSTFTQVSCTWSVANRTLTVKPTLPLIPDHRYRLHVPRGAVLDGWGNPLQGPLGREYEVRVDIDATPPTLGLAFPPSGSSGAAPWTAVVVEANEQLIRGSGNITLASPNGILVSMDVASATIVGRRAVFSLPPGARLTGGQRYTVTAPGGVLRDASTAANPNRAGPIGSFTVLSATFPSFNYLDYTGDLPRVQVASPIPELVAVYPPATATDVPVIPGVTVWMFFSGPVRFNASGLVSFITTSGVVATSDVNKTVIGNTTYLEILPNWNAVKIRIPLDSSKGQAIMERGELFTVYVPAGVLVDDAGRPLKEARATFRCLAEESDTTPPSIATYSPAADQAVVPNNTRQIDVYFTEDIQLTGRGGPLRLRRFPYVVLDTLIPMAAPAVTVSGNRLTILLPKGALSAGGNFSLTIPGDAIQDLVHSLPGGLLEGGGNVFGGAVLRLAAMVDSDPPLLNFSQVFPPPEDALTFSLPASTGLVLYFSEAVQVGMGGISLTPRYNSPVIYIPASDVTVLGSVVLASPPEGLRPGEVYNITINAGAFTDLNFNAFPGLRAGYIISTAARIRFNKVGSTHWAWAQPQFSGKRFGAAAAVDLENNLFVFGGANGTAGVVNASALNDVWKFATRRGVNCASSFNKSGNCSETMCKPDPPGPPSLGRAASSRAIWRQRSVDGASCRSPTGTALGRLGQELQRRVDICPCPLCLTPPGPPDGPALPGRMENMTYVSAYSMVTAANGTRPLLCEEGHMASGPFVCIARDRFIGTWATPYPDCAEPTGCLAPPMTVLVLNFVTFDPAQSTGGRDCSTISAASPMRHGGSCAMKCAPGFKASGTFDCQVGVWIAPRCLRQSCGSQTMQFGSLNCSGGVALMGTSCPIVCNNGYTASTDTVTCATDSTELEAQPTYIPEPRCLTSPCGPFTYAVGVGTVAYSSLARVLGDTATVTCKAGYTAVSPAALSLVCGVKRQAVGVGNAEWQVVKTGKRAGLPCVPQGADLREVVTVEGSLALEVVSSTGSPDLCTTVATGGTGSLAISVAVALTTVGPQPIASTDIRNVSLTGCPAQKARRRQLTQTGGQALEVKYKAVIPDMDSALTLKTVMETPSSSLRFAHTFASMLTQTTGVSLPKVSASPLVVAVSYDVFSKATTTTLTSTRTVTTTQGPSNGSWDMGSASDGGHKPGGLDPVGTGLVCAVAGLVCIGLSLLTACLVRRRRQGRYSSEVYPEVEDYQAQDEEEADGEEGPGDLTLFEPQVSSPALDKLRFSANEGGGTW